MYMCHNYEKQPHTRNKENNLTLLSTLYSTPSPNTHIYIYTHTIQLPPKCPLYLIS